MQGGVIKRPTAAFLTPFPCLWLALILLSPIYKVTHGRKTPHLIRGIKGVYPEIILVKLQRGHKDAVFHNSTRPRICIFQEPWRLC